MDYVWGEMLKDKWWLPFFWLADMSIVVVAILYDLFSNKKLTTRKGFTTELWKYDSHDY